MIMSRPQNGGQNHYFDKVQISGNDSDKSDLHKRINREQFGTFLLPVSLQDLEDKTILLPVI